VALERQPALTEGFERGGLCELAPKLLFRAITLAIR